MIIRLSERPMEPGPIRVHNHELREMLSDAALTGKNYEM